MSEHPKKAPAGGLRDDGWHGRAANIIYENDTLEGRLFDAVVLGAIVASVALVALETIPGVKEGWATWFFVAEWSFTLLFLAEYGLRLLVAEHPLAYARSFFGVIDLLSILPSLLVPIFPGAQHLMVIRALRLLRLFRVMNLPTFTGEASAMLDSIRRSARKILVFYLFVAVLVLIFGTVMYEVEGAENGFDSIPSSIYWAIVTITTVGFGDITPKTIPGRLIASFIMLTGYAILAVPTGIVSAEMARGRSGGRACAACGGKDHAPGAAFCQQCGAKLG